MFSLSLDHDLGIEQCAGLKQSLANHLQHPATLCLDGGAIARVHAASLQLLCALFRNRQHAGLETRWVSASPILREAARLLGLTTVLELSAQPVLPTTPDQDVPQDLDMEIAA